MDKQDKQERQKKLALIQGIMTGEVRAADIQRKTARFVLPGNKRDDPMTGR
jgi:hypothetical protein